VIEIFTFGFIDNGTWQNVASFCQSFTKEVILTAHNQQGAFS
jgi:hypothetical protein